MISNCLQCGRPVVAPPSRRADGRGRFCSRVCAGRWRVGPRSGRWVHGMAARAVVRCGRCGQQFTGQADSRFCSVACAKRPRTILRCGQCGVAFHAPHLSAKYCSWECCNLAKRVADRKPRAEATPEARRAQRRIAYRVATGALIRPCRCEQCDSEGPIEAAHFDYAEPERVRWLCRYCHRAWDQACPKRGTV